MLWSDDADKSITTHELIDRVTLQLAAEIISDALESAAEVCDGLCECGKCNDTFQGAAVAIRDLKPKEPTNEKS